MNKQTAMRPAQARPAAPGGKQEPEPATREPGALALMQKNLVGAVESKIAAWVGAGQLHLPADYSAANALKSAWLVLQETVDKDKQPVLQVCTRDSIANALLLMVVQGLTPYKKQCDFIAYGPHLSCQRSYMGSMMLVKRVKPVIEDIAAEVVYKDDVFTYRLLHGRREPVLHEQELKNVDGRRIVAAYAEALDAEGKVLASVVRTIDEIHAAWRQSRQHPFKDDGTIKPDSVHWRFPAEMCKRTVINALCKPIINTSSDSSVMRAVLKAAEAEEEELEIEDQLALANAESLPPADAEADDPGGGGNAQQSRDSSKGEGTTPRLAAAAPEPRAPF